MAIAQSAHVTELIMQSIRQMVQAHGFTWNDDLSQTEKGRLDKEFKLFLASAENNARTNSQATRILGTFEITLFHNAEGDTFQGQQRVWRDVENIIAEIERFAPTGVFENVNQLYVETTELQNWTTEPIEVGEDSRLRTVIQYEIGYKIPAA
jgi:hypothetical protein